MTRKEPGQPLPQKRNLTGINEKRLKHQLIQLVRKQNLYHQNLQKLKETKAKQVHMKKRIRYVPVPVPQVQPFPSNEAQLRKHQKYLEKCKYYLDKVCDVTLDHHLELVPTALMKTARICIEKYKESLSK